MTSSAPRAPIDFDVFERDLRQVTLPGTALNPAAAPKTDPLAELARIVGQDDPFRALLAARQGQGGEHPAPTKGAGPNGRVEPSFFETAPARNEVADDAAHPALSPADAFDQYLASVEQQDGHAEALGHDPAAFEDAPQAGYRAPGDGALAKRPRHRLVQVGAGLGVLVLCVTGALGWKAVHGRGADGGPVTVLADRSPLKVAPTAADGVEIPDQNKQIYERGAKDGQIKVVNREEQPLDVAQAARAGRDAAGGSAGATTPGNTAMLTDSLGEPRRVRTVSVKPETPPASMQRDAQRDTPAPRETQVASAEPVVGRAPLSPIPTMTMPDGNATPDNAASARRPSRTLASTNTPAASPKPTAPAATPTADAPAPAQTAEARRKATQRVAAATPDVAVPAPAAEMQTASVQSADAAPAATASIGGFSVQLGVRSSEADAQAAFKQMQGKYSQLAGKPALIRQAEVDGKSLYRVRVGPLAKAEASSLCSALKGAGSQCFVAKN